MSMAIFANGFHTVLEGEASALLEVSFDVGDLSLQEVLTLM